LAGIAVIACDLIGRAAPRVCLDEDYPVQADLAEPNQAASARVFSAAFIASKPDRVASSSPCQRVATERGRGARQDDRSGNK
jgi:hypothetical protein